MAIPEISHRCALCGAAIRVGAQWCPNCGQAETVAGPPRYEPIQVNLTPIGAEFIPDQPEDRPAEAPHYEPLPAVAEWENSAIPEEETSFDEFVEEIPEEPVAETQPLPEAEIVNVQEAEPTPAVKALEGPPPVYKRRRRRQRPPTLKERLAYRVEQLRGASKDATRKVAPKVEQLRETSNIVLDRADTDPSARFLLIGLLLIAIAAFVFIVSFFWG